MVNILLPAMGQSEFFKDYYFPKLLTEIHGETMLEHVIRNYAAVEEKQYILVLGQKECSEFHIDNSAKMLTGKDGKIVILKNQTKGALCTCLMAVEYIDSETPLIIANSDQIIDVDYNDVIRYFKENGSDAGVITFPSIHPRWSYAKTAEGEIVEVAEKRPFSKQAIAGFYYFKHGADFVEAAKRAILKQSSLNGRFYISASINELILMNRRVTEYPVEKGAYHPFYSPEKISEYEAEIYGKKQ